MTWWIVIIPVMYLVWLCVKSKGSVSDLAYYLIE